MKQRRRTNYNPDHYFFRREIKGFYPEKDLQSPGLSWLLAGAIVAVLILAAMFFRL